MNYTIIPLEEATKRFSLHDFLFADDRNNRHKVVKIAENDVELTDLHLDLLPNDNTVAYIFMGNLKVSGAIWNKETDFGVALIALKNVIAKNIAVGGQEVCIKGNLIVEQLLCGSCNHGIMTVKGDVKAQYILNDDYTFLFEGNVEATVLNDVKSGYHKVNNWKESLDNFAFVDASNLDYWDVLNPLVYDIYNNRFDFSRLVKLVNSRHKLFVNNEEKLKRLNHNHNDLTDLFQLLGLNSTNNIWTFGFGLREININFQFWRHFDDIYQLNIGLGKERFIYELKDGNLTIDYPVNGMSNFLSKENDFKNYYRAVVILVKSEAIVQNFAHKKNELLYITKNSFQRLFPTEFPFIYASIKAIFETPIYFYSENKAYFDALEINYMDWSFQKQALLHILIQSDIAIVINGKEYISTALIDLEKWFKKRGFDIETDWKARGLNPKRRIEYFSKDVLIVNDICKEKNIPLSILDFSLWLNDRFIVYFPIKNEHKRLFLEWLNEAELTK